MPETICMKQMLLILTAIIFSACAKKVDPSTTVGALVGNPNKSLYTTWTRGDGGLQVNLTGLTFDGVTRSIPFAFSAGSCVCDFQITGDQNYGNYSVKCCGPSGSSVGDCQQAGAPPTPSACSALPKQQGWISKGSDGILQICPILTCNNSNCCVQYN